MSTSSADRSVAMSVARRQRRRSPGFDTPVGRAIIQLLGTILLLLAWEAGVRAGFISAFLVGQPSGILSYLGKSVADGSLLRDTGYTLYEAILGFVIGTALGSALGLALWYSGFVARLVEPFIVAINSVPKIALAPIIILWFGTGLVSKVALSISLTAIVALIAAYQAAKDADPDLQSLLFSMGSDKHRIFMQVIVPSTLPAMIATFRINVGFGLVGAVVGEFISSQYGLGHLIFTASSLYDLNTVWAGLFTLMFVGFLLYYVIDFIERILLPWKISTTSQQLHV
ncbi:MAG: NitT/TauT family transport system permease protein [Methylobacteriaceae bacterium]|jgi:NitT/TauT family transport system permease protein|nr:NitT/TauT family transport system permease protein [Methylobacteriaceae bacterium]